MAKEKEKKEAKEMETTTVISGLKRSRIRIPIVGISPLISHRFGDKAKKKIQDKQAQSSKMAAGREKRDPEQEYKDSLYVMDDGRYGFPTAAFKGSLVKAASFTGKQFSKVLLRGALHIMGDYAPIKGTPAMREDMIRLPMGQADVRYRAEFKSWETELDILYNEAVISKEQIVQLLHLAGFSIGVGDWRPEHNGTHGMFDVKTPETK